MRWRPTRVILLVAVLQHVASDEVSRGITDMLSGMNVIRT
jgi:hypothetical protein